MKIENLKSVFPEEFANKLNTKYADGNRGYHKHHGAVNVACGKDSDDIAEFIKYTLPVTETCFADESKRKDYVCTKRYDFCPKAITALAVLQQVLLATDSLRTDHKKKISDNITQEEMDSMRKQYCDSVPNEIRDYLSNLQKERRENKKKYNQEKVSI